MLQKNLHVFFIVRSQYVHAMPRILQCAQHGHNALAWRNFCHARRHAAPNKKHEYRHIPVRDPQSAHGSQKRQLPKPINLPRWQPPGPRRQFVRHIHHERKCIRQRAIEIKNYIRHYLSLQCSRKDLKCQYDCGSKTKQHKSPLGKQAVRPSAPPP